MASIMMALIGLIGRRPMTRRFPPHSPWSSIASISPLHHPVSILWNPIQYTTFQEICLSHKIKDIPLWMSQSYYLASGNPFKGGSPPRCREHVLSDFILLLLHLTSSQALRVLHSRYQFLISTLQTTPVLMMKMMMMMVMILNTYYEPETVLRAL